MRALLIAAGAHPCPRRPWINGTDPPRAAVPATMDTKPVERRSNAAFARTLCALVALAAGLVGVLMLVAPDSTDRYFSWALAPAPLAAFVGACYVASAAVFGWAAAREDGPGLHGLCVAVFGLTVPTLIATIHHRSVFDFGRWQAVLWLGLFIASPVLFGLTLVLARRSPRPVGPGLRPWARILLGVMSAAYAALAVVALSAPSHRRRARPDHVRPDGHPLRRGLGRVPRPPRRPRRRATQRSREPDAAPRSGGLAARHTGGGAAPLRRAPQRRPCGVHRRPRRAGRALAGGALVAGRTSSVAAPVHRPRAGALGASAP